MTAAYIRRIPCCQELVLPRTCARKPGFLWGAAQKGPKNANDPGTAGRAYIRRNLCYSKVVPAPEFFAQRRRYKLNGNGNAALQGAKEALFTPLLVRDFLDHRPSRHGRGRGRPRPNGGRAAAGPAGAVPAAGSTFAGLGGLPYWPIGPKTTATASTIAATIAPKMPPTDSDDMETHPCSRCAQ